MKTTPVPSLYVKSFACEYSWHRSGPDLTPLVAWGGPEKAIRDIFTKARAMAPCLLILEDLDSLIDDQNRSFFLNELDGLESNVCYCGISTLFTFSETSNTRMESCSSAVLIISTASTLVYRTVPVGSTESCKHDCSKRNDDGH